MTKSITIASLLASLFCTFLVLGSCSGEDKVVRKKAEIRKDIEANEDKIMEASKAGQITEEMQQHTEDLMGYLLEFYHSYPKSKDAASCLAKVHMLHSRLGNSEKAVAYGDTLLNEYPKYENRAQIIESQIQSYEMDIKPRNVEKIKKYLKLWLAENKKAPQSKIEDMEYHLKFVDMSLEERMRMNMEDLD